MKQKDMVTIIIVITVALAIVCYLLNDNSSVAVTDIHLEEKDNQTSNLTYNLLIGKHFEQLEVESVIYNKANETLSQNRTKITNISVGVIPIQENHSFEKQNEENVPQKIRITIYENDVNKSTTKMLTRGNYTLSSS